MAPTQKGSSMDGREDVSAWWAFSAFGFSGGAVGKPARVSATPTESMFCEATCASNDAPRSLPSSGRRSIHCFALDVSGPQPVDVVELDLLPCAGVLGEAMPPGCPDDA